MRNEKYPIYLFVILFASLICFSALAKASDSQLYIAAGGDSQITLQSIGGSQISFSGSPPVTPTPSPSPSPGGGGGAGTVTNIKVTPNNLTVNLALGQKIEKTLNITNLGTGAVNLSISQQNLTNLTVLRNKYIYLTSKQSKTINIAFIDNNKTGTFTGKLLIGNQEIPIVINIRSVKLLFDVEISVLNPNQTVEKGGTLNTAINMIPMGDQERLDVKLDYQIKDFSNNVYLEKSEDVFVDSQRSIDRSFNISSLKPGKYVISVSLSYPGGTAPASARFTVSKSAPAVPKGQIIFYAIAGFIISSVIAILLIVISSLRRQRKNQLPQPQTGEASNY